MIPKHYKALILVGFLIAGACAFWFGGWYLLSGQVSELESVSAEIESALSQVGRHDELKNELEEAEDSIKKLNKLFISEDDLIGFIERLEREAKDKEIDLSVERFEERSERVGLTLLLTGSESRLRSFLGRLPQLPFLLKIEDFSLWTPGSFTSDEMYWSGELNMVLLGLVEK